MGLHEVIIENTPPPKEPIPPTPVPPAPDIPDDWDLDE